MKTRRYAPLAICLIAFAAGCKKGEEAAAPAPESAPATAAEAPAPAPLPTSEPLIAPTAAAAAPSSTAPASAPAPAPGVIASQETNWPGIVAEVTEFRRKGNTLTAKVRLRNQGSENVAPDFYYTEVYLLDAAAGKKYEVLKDEKDNYFAALHSGHPNRWFEWVNAGQSLTVWMKFAAPPPAVKTVTLQIPKVQPFEDLPIQD